MEPLFGDLFDLNGDGVATPFEEMLGLGMLDEMEREERRNHDGGFDDFDDESEFGEDDL